MAGGLIVGSVFAVVRLAVRARAQGLDQGELQELEVTSEVKSLYQN